MVSDALGQPVSINEPHPEEPGTPVSLTLDANIQQRTEDVLGGGRASVQPKRRDGDRDGPAQRRDPGDGQLAAGQRQRPGGSSPEALQNRAVGFDYEPGSTFKALTVAGALQQGLVKPTSSFFIPDKIQVADRTIHDDTEHGDESLTTAQILAQSSNVGAIKIGALEGKTDVLAVGQPASASASARASSCPARKSVRCCR